MMEGIPYSLKAPHQAALQGLNELELLWHHFRGAVSVKNGNRATLPSKEDEGPFYHLIAVQHARIVECTKERGFKVFFELTHTEFAAASEDGGRTEVWFPRETVSERNVYSSCHEMVLHMLRSVAFLQNHIGEITDKSIEENFSFIVAWLMQDFGDGFRHKLLRTELKRELSRAVVNRQISRFRYPIDDDSERECLGEAVEQLCPASSSGSLSEGKTERAESNSLDESGFVGELKELRGEFQALKAMQVSSAFVTISGDEITFLYWPEIEDADANLHRIKVAIHDLTSLWERAGAILRRLEQASPRFHTFLRADSDHHSLYWAAGILGAGVVVPSQETPPLIPYDLCRLHPKAVVQQQDADQRVSFADLEIADPVAASVRFVDHLLGQLYAPPPTKEQTDRQRRELEIDLMQKTFYGFNLDTFRAVGGIFHQAKRLGIRVEYPRSLAELERNLGAKYRRGEGLSLIERTEDGARVHRECREALDIVKKALVADYERRESENLVVENEQEPSAPVEQLAVGKKKPKKKPGRKKATKAEREAKIKADQKLIADCKASGQPKHEFCRARGYEPCGKRKNAVTLAEGRERKRKQQKAGRTK